MNVRIRPVGDDEIGAPAVLRQAWVEENSGGPIDDPAYATAFATWWARERDRRLAWLASVDDTAVGMLSMAIFDRMPKPGSPPSRWGYVSNVYVLPAHRGAGIGRQLIDAALERARADTYARVVLAPSERSRPLYARAGFGPADDLLLLDRP